MSLASTREQRTMSLIRALDRATKLNCLIIGFAVGAATALLYCLFCQIFIE